MFVLYYVDLTAIYTRVINRSMALRYDNIILSNKAKTVSLFSASFTISAHRPNDEKVICMNGFCCSVKQSPTYLCMSCYVSRSLFNCDDIPVAHGDFRAAKTKDHNEPKMA